MYGLWLTAWYGETQHMAHRMKTAIAKVFRLPSQCTYIHTTVAVTTPNVFELSSDAMHLCMCRCTYIFLLPGTINMEYLSSCISGTVSICASSTVFDHPRPPLTLSSSSSSFSYSAWRTAASQIGLNTYILFNCVSNCFSSFAEHYNRHILNAPSMDGAIPRFCVQLRSQTTHN